MQCGTTRRRDVVRPCHKDQMQQEKTCPSCSRSNHPLLSPTKSHQKPKKTIRFNESACVYRIPGLDSFSDTEVRKTWWSVDDEIYKNAMADVQDLKRRKEQGLAFDHGSQVCYRGLEHRVGKRRVRKVVRRDAAKTKVLDEQYLQWEEGSEDPEYIADLYSEISRLCLQEAQEVARIDREDIISYVSDSELMTEPRTILPRSA